LTCRVCSSMPSPKSSTPALFEATVRSLTPASRIAAIRSSGMPQRPKPPAAMVMPSNRSPSSASAPSRRSSSCAPPSSPRPRSRAAMQRSQARGRRAGRLSMAPRRQAGVARRGKPEMPMALTRPARHAPWQRRAWISRGLGRGRFFARGLGGRPCFVGPSWRRLRLGAGLSLRPSCRPSPALAAISSTACPSSRRGRVHVPWAGSR
jgi:hypothetical protein